MTDDPRRSHAFVRLSPAEIEVLSHIGEQQRFADGALLFTAGEAGGGFYVVLSGAIEIIDSSTGADRVIGRHEKGGFTGDIDILGGRRPVVSAVARGETDVLSVPSRQIRRIIGDRPGLGEKILQAFIARRELLVESGFEGLRVIGSGSSRDAFRIREFLSRNQIRVTWIDLDVEPHVEELLQRFGIERSETPVVAFGTRPLFRNPTNRELADLLGLRRTTPESAYDLVIVGAGPAGLAAAVYGASEGLGTLVLDRAAPGGQAGTSTKIENYLGFPTGISGSELTTRALVQAQKFGAQFSTPSEVAHMEREGDGWALRLDDDRQVLAGCVLIATGADYRKLDVPGRADFDGLGVYYAATQMELVACRGAEVVVVGAGNSAGQAAMFLAQHTARVWVLVRGPDLRASMSSYLADRIGSAEHIEVLHDTVVRRMHGDDRLRSVEIENTVTGELRTIATPAVFTFIGATPRTAWLPRAIETDAAGFIVTGRAACVGPESWSRDPFFLETSADRVFAAGDVRVGSIKRVASAVGEGAMVIKYVHERLAARGAGA
jgi:thioredoxin reductase (NADPH)